MRIFVNVGSTNQTKINGTKVVFEDQFIGSDAENSNGRRIPKNFEEVQVFSCEIESVVSSTPRSDDECILGATHRAKVFEI